LYGHKCPKKAVFLAFFQKNVQKSLQVIKLMPIFAPKNVALMQETRVRDVKKQEK
jgi:hypothetical protein